MKAKSAASICYEHGISAYPEYVISAVGRPAAVVINPTQSIVLEPNLSKSVERPT